MTVVDFLRHGKTDATDALLGRTDLPLSAAGREAIAQQIAGHSWSAIVTSPLLRARETAAIAAGASGQRVEIDDDWREMDFGDWDGKAHSNLAQDVRLAAFYQGPEANPPPNGETMDEVRQRIAAALNRLAVLGGDVLVVAHGGSIRMALSLLLAIPVERLWAIRIACATRIRVNMGADPKHGLWGEIVEIIQPSAKAGP